MGGVLYVGWRRADLGESSLISYNMENEVWLARSDILTYCGDG